MPWRRQAADKASASAGLGGPDASGSSAFGAGRLNDRTNLSKSPWEVTTSQRAS